MANETYFKNFNKIQYANNTVIDITERIVILNNVQKNPYIYYPSDITNGVRPDQITNQFYKDPFMSWVLYLTNDITDPYYEWYLNQDQFDNFIVSKYGSLSAAMQKVAFWRNDWVDKPNMSTTAYAAEISNAPELVKYWKPNYNLYGSIIDYSRTPEDWMVNTNKFIQYYTDSDASGFIPGEIVNVGNGKAQVVQSNSSILIVKNPINNREDTYETITGTESGVIIDHTAITSVTYFPANISNYEIVYWKPVYYYDMENEKNEGNRSIKTMQPQYIPKYIKNVKDLLKV